MDVGDSPDWPPPGWTEVVKVTNGRKIKYYTNGETGKKFYSKKEVTRYLSRKDICDDATQAMNNHGKSCSENNVSPMNNQDESISKDNVSQMDNQDKSCSENNASENVGGPNNSLEWLPPGWIVELKTRKSGSHAGATYKVFVDPSTGNKFYSKPEVSKYLKTMKQNNIVGGGQIHGNGEVSSSNQKRSEDSKNIKGRGQSRISKRQKSDTDQASPGIEGGSFFKQKACQDFEEVGKQSCIAQRKKSGINRTTKTSPSHGAGEDFILNEKTSLGSKERGAQSPQSKRQNPGIDCPSAKSVSSISVDGDSADELPPGWKKEVISRQTDRGTRKDLIFTDPVHGYTFRSKKEVFRYLQTGDARRCARRPAKKNVASTSKDDSPTTDDTSLKKFGCFMTGRQLFAADESKGGKSFGTFSPSQQFESSKKQPECSVSDPNAIITSILAEINENHSFETVEDAEVETVIVDVEQPSAVATELDLPEKQLLENKQEKHSYKAAMRQSRKSRNTESANLGRRVSKRLAGQNPEAAADLNLGECALPAVVDKSAPPSLSVNACSQELLQDSVPTPETGKSDQASLNGEASLDELPPGWKKEIKITKKAHGIRKDPLYIDPVHGYVFRSKKDIFRYLQTGDISSCAIRPVKRDLDATTTETSPTTVDTNSKKLGCSVTKRQPFAAKESKGRKRSVTCSPELQAESSKKQPESGVSNANTIVRSSAADINAKHSTENAEISLDTEPEIRDSSADTKVIAAESDTIKRLSAVSTPQSDLTPEQQLPETECQKPINKEKLEQSRRSRIKKPLTPGRRISKRLVGHSPEPVADLDLGERAFRAVVKKSASLGIPPNVSGQEFSQNKDPKVGTGNSDQASPSREASGVEFPPDVEKEILIQNEDPTVGTVNCDQVSLSREASGDELAPGLEKEILSQNEDPTVGTGNCDPVSLSREASGDELAPGLEKEILSQNKDPTVGTGNCDQASLSKEVSGDELSPSLEKELVAQNKDPTVGTGNSDQASLSRDASEDKLSPGSEKDLLAQNKDPMVGTGNSYQASLSREASGDILSPGLEKELLAQNKDPMVGTGNSYQASLSREASGDKLSPGLAKEILAQNNDPTVGTGNSDQASLSREASGDKSSPGLEKEILASLRREALGDKSSPGLEKEILAQNNYPTVGTGNSDQASLSRKASGDKSSPGVEKEVLAQNNDPTVGTGNSDQSSLSRKASVDELTPGLEKEVLTQNKDPTVGTGNSDQSSLSRKASVDELSPGLEKEILTQNKDPIVGTGNSDQSSLSRKASEDELSQGLEKEILTQSKDLTVASGNSDQASLRREASLDDIPPGWEKEILGQNKYSTVGTGNSNQPSLSRKLSPDEIPPGWENEIPPGWKYEIPAQNKDPIIGTSNSDQASLSREEASLDEIPPGWEKEILAYNKRPTIRTGKSDQASLRRELASADELPPGWEKEMLIRNKYPTVGTGNSNSLDDIPPGWEKELLVQSKDPTVGTGNSNQSLLSKEASADELPPGWKKEFRMRKHSRGIKKDPFYTDPVHGYVFRSKKDVMRYLQTGDIRSCAVKPTKRDLDLTMKDNSTSTHDTSSKKLRCSLTGRQLSATEESKDSKCSVTCSLALHAENSNEHPESSMLNLNTSISSIEAVSPQLDYLPEQQLPENEKEKHNNKGVPKVMRKFRNSKSSTPVRRVSKRLSRHNPEMVADLDLREHALQAVVNNSASSGLPMNVSGGELAQKTDLATGDSIHPSLRRKDSSRDDPFKVVRCLSEGQAEGQAFKEQNDERILQDSQPAGISHERGKFHLEHHAVKQRLTGKLAKVEQDGQNRLLDNSQPAEPSWRNVDLNVENQQWQDVQLAPSQRSVDLNMENQQWQDSQLAPSQRSVDLNVENQQWQDPQLTEPSRRNLDLNVENQPMKEKQTGELVTENQDEQNRRLHAQLASYPFGDYWPDPCLEFAFKTLTGAIPVEYNTSYAQADDGCFDMQLFNDSTYYMMHDVPNHCGPSEEHIVKEQPPINQTFLPPGNNSTPGHSTVVSQNPGLTFLPNGNNSTPGCSSVVSQNPGLSSQAKDYQSKFKSQR